MGEPIYNRKIEQAATVTSDLKTYTLSPEELARYGPVVPRKKSNNQFHARVMNAVKVSESPEEAAKLLKITVNSLKQYLGAREIFPRWETKTEEVADMVRPESVSGGGRLEFLKARLTKDQYLAYKEKKLSDPDILKKVGISKTTWIPVLTALKKEWGLGGLKANMPETMLENTYQEEKQAAEAVGVFLSKLGSAMAWASVKTAIDENLKKEAQRDQDLSVYGEDSEKQAAEAIGVFLERLGLVMKFPLIFCKTTPANTVELEPDTDDDEVEWATPFKPVDRRPILTVNAKHVCLNTGAQKELEGVDTVMVGVSKRGILILRQALSPNAYKVSRNEKYKDKGSSAKIGGGTLVQFLKSHGIKLGKYVLAKNEKHDWWEARAMEVVNK